MPRLFLIVFGVLSLVAPVRSQVESPARPPEEEVRAFLMAEARQPGYQAMSAEVVAARAAFLRDRSQAVKKVAAEYLPRYTLTGMPAFGEPTHDSCLNALYVVDREAARAATLSLFLDVHRILRVLHPILVRDFERGTNLLTEDERSLVRYLLGVKGDLYARAADWEMDALVDVAKEMIDADPSSSPAQYLRERAKRRPEVAAFLREKAKDPKSRWFNSPMLLKLD